MITITSNKLKEYIFSICSKYTDTYQSDLVAKMITRAEIMGVYSHGLHYFLHSVLPLIKEGKTKKPSIKSKGSFIFSDGEKTIGLVNTYEIILKLSKMAKQNGIAMGFIKNPGKVGTLRIFCSEVIKKGQLIIITKNTAPTMGLTERSIGTNPICIGLPNTRFIYDASMATIATNKVRYQKKKGEKFKNIVGKDQNGNVTKDPETLLENGYLLPFSPGPFWYKSFFLGVAIEAMCALAGGKTGERVGESRGQRLYSKEGMLILIVDCKQLPEYENYLEEIKKILTNINLLDLSIPGAKEKRNLVVLKKDIKELYKEMEVK